MKLTKWAKEQGITYRTAWQWFMDGNLPVPAVRTATGTILVQEKIEKIIQNEKIFIYGRVSSNEQKQNLNTQVSLCEQFCIAKGLTVDKIYKEVASGMNDNRRELNKIFDNPPTKLVVLHKDRLTRFGFNFIKRYLESKNCEIIIINNIENKDDLLKDFISVITSFCAKLYGARRGQAKALKLKTELNDKII